MLLRPFCAILAAVFLSSAFAEEAEPRRFFNKKAEGWFWYDDPKDLPPPKEVEPPKPKSEKPEEKKAPEQEPFSVEWLRENMPKLLDSAINNPTKENVEAYLYAQRVAMDKSQLYAEKARQVVANDPLLDENNRVPLSSFAKPAFLKKVKEGQEEAVKHLAGVGGIWFFFDSKCDFCKTQAVTIQEVTKRYGFNTRYISVDGKGLPNIPEFSVDKGHAKMLDLKLTPTTVFVVPPNNYFVVSQGLMAQEQLLDRIVIAADSANLIPQEVAAKAKMYDRGVLSNEDTQKGASKDPKEWVKYLKERLQGRY